MYPYCPLHVLSTCVTWPSSLDQLSVFSTIWTETESEVQRIRIDPHMHGQCLDRNCTAFCMHELMFELEKNSMEYMRYRGTVNPGPLP